MTQGLQDHAQRSRLEYKQLCCIDFLILQEAVNLFRSCPEASETIMHIPIGVRSLGNASPFSIGEDSSHRSPAAAVQPALRRGAQP